MAAEPEPAPPGAPLPPEVRPVKPPASPLPWVAFRVLVVLLPLAAGTFLCVSVALSGLVFGDSRDRASTLLCAALAAAGAWQTRRSARKTWGVYRGWEPARQSDLLVNLASILGGVGLLIAFAAYSMQSMFRYRTEKQTQGRLGTVRSALSIYYGDMEGAYPADLLALTVAGKYLSELPKADIPKHHWSSTKVRSGARADDAGGWMYNNVPGDANRGTFWVNCTHTDTRGSVWTVY